MIWYYWYWCPFFSFLRAFFRFFQTNFLIFPLLFLHSEYGGTYFGNLRKIWLVGYIIPIFVMYNIYRHLRNRFCPQAFAASSPLKRCSGVIRATFAVCCRSPLSFFFAEATADVMVTASGTIITDTGSMVCSEPILTATSAGSITLMVGMTIVKLEHISGSIMTDSAPKEIYQTPPNPDKPEEFSGGNRSLGAKSGFPQFRSLLLNRRKSPSWGHCSFRPISQPMKFPPQAVIGCSSPFRENHKGFRTFCHFAKSFAYKWPNERPHEQRIPGAGARSEFLEPDVGGDEDGGQVEPGASLSRL